MPHARLDTSSLSQLAERASLQFEQRFGRAPRAVVAAPGRVNLMGEHTDYNGGFVLPMSIDRYVVMAGDAPTTGDAANRVRCYSHAFDETACFDVTADHRPGDPGWSNFVRGVVAGMANAWGELPGFDGTIDTNIPLGCGLSSSAALEAATATLMEALLGRNLDPSQKAHLCQRAEHEFVGVPCGIMDQLSSILGSPTDVLLIDCESEQVQRVPLSDDVSVLVINCHVRHTLASSPYADRRSTCHRVAEKLGARSLRHVTSHQLESFRDQLSPWEYGRARHVITENLRARTMAEVISNRDWHTAGALMYESHASMRDDFEISCPELNLLVEAAQRIGPTGGVYGARLTGGGFGGSTVSLVQTDKACLVAERLVADYQRQFGSIPDWFVPRPAAGARVLSGPTTGSGCPPTPART